MEDQKKPTETQDKQEVEKAPVAAEVENKAAKQEEKTVEKEVNKKEETKDKKKKGPQKPHDEKSKIYLKVGILAAFNILLFFVLLSSVGKLPLTVDKIQTARLENPVLSQEELAVIQQQIASSSPKAEEIKTYFPDESGVVNFVGEIDKFKASGIVTGFSFASDGVINDRTKAPGLPILIEIKGTPEQIDSVLQSIQRLPYFLRAINVSIEKSEEEGMLEFSFGGVLYVDEEIAGN